MLSYTKIRRRTIMHLVVKLALTLFVFSLLVVSQSTKQCHNGKAYKLETFRETIAFGSTILKQKNQNLTYRTREEATAVFR